MCKIFVGDKPIILTTKVEQESNFKNYLLDTVNIGKVITEIKKKAKKIGASIITTEKDFTYSGGIFFVLSACLLMFGIFTWFT